MSLRSLVPRFALAVAIPAAVFLGLEGALRLAGYGKPSAFLIPDEKPGYLRSNPEFASLFLPGNFDLRPLNFRVSVHKPEGSIRVVLLGESAAQGVPVPSFAFAEHLRSQLRARYPGHAVEVLNTGIVAVNSHVIYQIARDMARVEPDLFVVYMGNNEVVGPYGPGCAYLSEMPPLWLIRASVFVRSTRTGQLLSALVARAASGGRRPAEWGGMSMFVDHAVTGDDPRLEAVYRNFESNLRGIVREASGCGARTLLCTVVANLQDCAPFLSRHRGGMSESEQRAWSEAFEAGRLSWRLGEFDAARAKLTEAVRLDPHYADTLFMLGRIELHAGEVAAARGHLVEALHWDALRFRPDPRINAIIRSVAATSGPSVDLCDAAVELGADPASAEQPSGRTLLFEHVHFDWEGNYQMGLRLAQCAGGLLEIAPTPRGAWLSPAAAASALAYGEHERLPMLLRMDVLVRKPPFTAQLTHVLDQARMARDIDAATQAAHAPATLAEAERIARAALSADPENPALAGILEGIEIDRGDEAAALRLAERAASELPADFALSADRASILMRLGRVGEAGTLLTAAASSGADADMLAPALLDYWTRAHKADEGIQFLGRALAARPADRRLRLVLGSLLQSSGDGEGAERTFRLILEQDPADSEALEALVGLLVAQGRDADAAAQSVASAPSQPGNQANDLRASKALESRGDEAGSLSSLEAAESSGPVNATFELALALKFYRLGRRVEMMTRLAQARALSLEEGNPSVTVSIDRLIERMRREAPPR